MFGLQDYPLTRGSVPTVDTSIGARAKGLKPDAEFPTYQIAS